VVSDVLRLRYVFLKFSRGYTAGMKTLVSSLQFAESDPSQFRLHVLEHCRVHGTASAVAAFGISRRTYLHCKEAFVASKGRLSLLIPPRTCPKRTSRMISDEPVATFIRELREEYGRVGKEKLKVLLMYTVHHWELGLTEQANWARSSKEITSFSIYQRKAGSMFS